MTEIVLPGESLASTEEFEGRQGTREAPDGMLVSTVAGKLEKDASRRSVAVKAFKRVRRLMPGDLVYGKVHNVYAKVALVQFQPASPGVASARTYAYLRVSELSRDYARNFGDYIRIGDLIRARVKEVKELGSYLTIADGDLGVIKPVCTRCRHELRGLECPRCGSKERRKTPRGDAPPQRR